MTYEVEVNDAVLRAKWERVQREFPATMTRAMGAGMLYVHSQVPGYPAPPAGSTYRRTGTLGRGITTEVRPLGADVVGVIGTAVVYAPYVIDELKPQAAVHQGRWYTLQKVVRGAVGKVADMLRDAVVKLLR